MSGGGGVGVGVGAGCLGRICFRDKRSKEDGREDAAQAKTANKAAELQTRAEDE